MSQARWARGGAPQCTATLGRNGPCGTQAGAFGLRGAAQYLKEGWAIILKQETLPAVKAFYETAHQEVGFLCKVSTQESEGQRSLIGRWVAFNSAGSLTCLNAGDARGVEHPLHLSGAHRNCAQCPQLRRMRGEMNSKQRKPRL